jgi:hypothetical protein
MWAWPNTKYQIPARILADVIAPPLTLIFQKSLDEGNIPNDWRTANVTAIFKKGERYKASNYRPVSLISLCCKVQELIIVSSILIHLDAHQILTDCQHGFRARRSCETQLLTLAHELFPLLPVVFGCSEMPWSILVWNLGYRSDQVSSGVFHVVLDQKLLKNRGW